MKRSKQRQDTSPKIKPLGTRYDPENNPPRFSFRDIVNDSKFSYNSLEREDKVNLINTLNMLGHLIWAQIHTQPRHKSGCEIIPRESLKFTLPGNVPEESNILAFRFSGMATMLGYRSTFGTFYILAFDTKFKAYKHE
jgi:hypothetical protein